MKPFRLMGLVLLLAVLPVTVCGGDSWPLSPSELRIEQVFVNMPETYLYFRITDNQGAPLTRLTAGQLELRLDGQMLQPDESWALERCGGLGQGLAVTLLLDVSLSVRGAAFSASKQVAHDLIGQMKSSDRMSVVNVGDSVQILQGFTGDKELLKHQLEGISPAASNTLLYKGLSTAFTHNQSLLSGVPGRRIVVLLSDGRDEGSGMTLDELVSMANTPVFALGYAGGSREYIEPLRRISESSGGIYLHITTPDQLRAATNRIQEVLKGGWVLKLSLNLPQRLNDNAFFELISKGTPQLSSRREQRLFSSRSEAQLRALIPLEKEDRRFPLWAMLAIAALVLVIALVWVLLAGRKRKSDRNAWYSARDERSVVALEFYLSDFPKGKFRDKAQELLTEVRLEKAAAESDGFASSPAESRRVRKVTAVLEFIIVEGNDSGVVERKGVMDGVMSIGSGEAADWVISGELVSSLHAEIVQQEKNGRTLFFVQDIEGSAGTYLNGIPIQYPKRIQRGDVIGIGGQKVRFLGEVKE